ncbi:hypothetical protein, partial [Klebsiella pneumoniae]|uniref:hypothetical protein n=2 Tax=Klebsiella pneumoniae TaxID=573 RepID=UPI0021D2F88E
DLLNLPPGINFTRLRAVRRKGVNEHGPVQMSGGEREIFFGLMKRQRNGREKFIAKGSAVPWTARRVVLVSAPANGLKRVIRPGERSRHPPQRRRARARNGVALQSAGSFIAGTVKAARPERSQQALPLTLTSDIRH